VPPSDSEILWQFSGNEIVQSRTLDVVSEEIKERQCRRIYSFTRNHGQHKSPLVLMVQNDDAGVGNLVK
jgi:hypothetical protein